MFFFLLSLFDTHSVYGFVETVVFKNMIFFFGGFNTCCYLIDIDIMRKGGRLVSCQ